MVIPIPRVLAFVPSGLSEPGLVAAASRAGGLGVFDFANDFRASEAIRAARRVAHLVNRPFGLRLPADEIHAALLRDAPDGLRVLIATEPSLCAWTQAVSEARSLGLSLLAEVTSKTMAEAAAEVGVEGLILAGHEAGGRGSDLSSLILLQAVLSKDLGVPVWVRGGIGPRAASACVATGATGVVLDGALLLTRESPLPTSIRNRISSWDGGETIVLGPATDSKVRVHARPGAPVLSRLREAADEGVTAWLDALRIEVGWGDDQAWPVGQDAALASELARRYVTVGGVIQAVEQAMDDGVRLARSLRPLAEGSSLARSHGTRFPIVQGPMTRVSDTPAFAEAVANGGALPFLALALMRGPDCRSLMAEVAERLKGRPWGVGILGFVPPDLRREQVEAIQEIRPPFALIAGGRPDQARLLEQVGIATYLHAPSPGLLRQFLRDGARRFVLEGRECGGHVGPRSSLILWEQAIGVILGAIDEGVPAAEIHLLFAGGIHDGRSASVVSAMSGPLAARGVKVGVLVGTAYLFTEEAVASGAIVPGFQQEALRCERTVLLETGPGHEVRVSPTPFAERFEHERRRFLEEGLPAEEVRERLERLNTGRLRVAAKGIDRSLGGGSPFVRISPDEQHASGVYMLGQVATLRDRVTTIAQLHREICDGSIPCLEHASIKVVSNSSSSAPSDVAIIGMAAIMPGAADVRTFWENTLRGVDSIVEVPPDRWDWRLYYDPDPKAPDKITSKWGGFLPDIPFDPLRYGMPPSSLSSIEPMQLLLLEAVRSALDDAGYRDRPFPRERTSVVLGAGGGAAQLAMGYAFRSYLPMLDTVEPGLGRAVLERCGSHLPEWTEDSFPGILLNVAAGRIANRFDLGGANYTVDAACGSSLAAAALAVRELESGAADMVLLGGADTVQNPFTYLAFSKTHAFSPRGRCRPFDASADGIVISEGVAVVVLKRLADAERDGDRIYAVIKGLGASSDGRAKGLTAPRAEGQVSALERAYEKAGVSPSTVGYVETHGTGTAAGDSAEVEALTAVFDRAGADRGRCALGSVKSLIGHTKCAAGLAGLINASLSLYHKVYPPTIGVVTPNPRANFASSPFYPNTLTRPWLHDGEKGPRRAGVSAFGFGGTNFHAVLEEYDRDALPPGAPLREWPAELLVWQAETREELLEHLDRLAGLLESEHAPRLVDLSASLIERLSCVKSWKSRFRLALVAATLGDLRSKLDHARRELKRGTIGFTDPRGLSLEDPACSVEDGVAFVFPGQGSQYPDMLRELAVVFPEVRETFESFDRALRLRGGEPVGPKIFSAPAFEESGQDARREVLRPTEVAQPAVGAACLAMLRLLESFGLEAGALAGHSYGELVALQAAGSLTEEGLAALSEARARLILGAIGEDPGTMAAVGAGPDRVAELLEGLDGVWAVNLNGPSQTVLSGKTEAVRRVAERTRQAGLRVQELSVACAFHTPLVANAREPLATFARSLEFRQPRRPVYSNLTAAPYPADPRKFADQLGDHLAQPVRFAEMIESLYKDGSRVFVEVGPGAALTALIDAILGDRPHRAIACDPPGRSGLPGLLQALGRLFTAGVPLRLERLVEGRSPRRLDPRTLLPESPPEAGGASLWIVNGTRARPAQSPEPARLGVSTDSREANGTPSPHLPRPSEAPERPGHERHFRNGTGYRVDRLSVDTASRNRGPAAPGASRVVVAFQETMRNFLGAQRSSMLEYLGSRHRNGSTAVGLPPHSSPAAELSQNRSPQKDTAGLNRNVIEKQADGQNTIERTLDPLIDRVSLSERLLRIVQQRTGYPTEMLRLDLDLEADLGIDSIKRVEILGSLRDELPCLAFDSQPDLMDSLARARTLGMIVDKLESLAKLTDKATPGVETEPSQQTRTDASSSASAQNEKDITIRRLVIATVDSPLASTRKGLMPGGVVLITDDGRGIARAVAADLRSLGHPVVRVRHGLSDSEVEGLNLTSEAAVSALLDRVRCRGSLAGIVHLLPLRDLPPARLDSSAWAGRIGPEVRGLFLLARAGADDLARAAERGGACLIAATGMGGAFASVKPVSTSFFPGHGGVAGLVKTLAREWPEVRTRVVDLEPSSVVEVTAADLVHEILTDDPHSEVGYQQGRRLALRTVEAPLANAVARGLTISPGEPVLITGGARGITATVAADLARRWKPTLLLIGSSPLPPEEENAATSGLDSPADLKAALWTMLQSSKGEVGPADVERAHRTLLCEREIRRNLKILRNSGSVVRYAQVDVRDGDALARVLAAWRSEFGSLVGFIHGAGVIQDKLLRDKTVESFDRVLGTKIEGALNLARHIDPASLRFAAFFSSIAGRFGNRGQADYSAANETLNKLAVWLDQRWPGRVVSLIWGPWSGIGMVSEIEQHLVQRGLDLIPPGRGSSLLVDELRLGGKGDVEILLAGRLGQLETPLAKREARP